MGDSNHALIRDKNQCGHYTSLSKSGPYGRRTHLMAFTPFPSDSRASTPNADPETKARHGGVLPIELTTFCCRTPRRLELHFHLRLEYYHMYMTIVCHMMYVQLHIAKMLLNMC